METITGYEMIQILNERLEEEGIDQTVPTQMAYNYMKKGYIPFVEVDGKKRVELTEASTWVENQVSKRKNKSAKNTNELEGQLSLI